MKAAFIERTGPPEVIRVGELPMPALREHQVLVRVKAVSVNPIDTYLRAGAVPMPLPMPYILGCDLAGVVEAVGSQVRRFRPGDRVWGSNQGLLGRQGTFAEYAAVDECWLYPAPAGVEDEALAAVALVGITAHLGLFRNAQLRAGETLFVNGGSGGVGSMVVQMAKIAGATVIATAGSEAKAKICRELGADYVIEYQKQDVVQSLRQFAPNGVQIWWETQREPDFDRAISCLAQRGRMVVMAGREARPPFPVGPFYVKDCSLFGFVMFNATPEEQEACAKDINRWLAEGRLQPRIDRILPLAEAANAHRLQEENTLRKTGVLAGKIVLRCG
ncbi:MAG: NADPH:quinone reductase [Verrucomicrobiae bacterium]|nr:NADPH:quinone reductase [Verrucomicrobiae bacterium]